MYGGLLHVHGDAGSPLAISVKCKDDHTLLDWLKGVNKGAILMASRSSTKRAPAATSIEQSSIVKQHRQQKEKDHRWHRKPPVVSMSQVFSYEELNRNRANDDEATEANFLDEIFSREDEEQKKIRERQEEMDKQRQKLKKDVLFSTKQAVQRTEKKVTRYRKYLDQQKESVLADLESEKREYLYKQLIETQALTDEIQQIQALYSGSVADVDAKDAQRRADAKKAGKSSFQGPASFLKLSRTRGLNIGKLPKLPNFAFSPNQISLTVSDARARLRIMDRLRSVSEARRNRDLTLVKAESPQTPKRHVTFTKVLSKSVVILEDDDEEDEIEEDEEEDEEQEETPQISRVESRMVTIDYRPFVSAAVSPTPLSSSEESSQKDSKRFTVSAAGKLQATSSSSTPRLQQLSQLKLPPLPETSHGPVWQRRPSARMVETGRLELAKAFQRSKTYLIGEIEDIPIQEELDWIAERNERLLLKEHSGDSRQSFKGDGLEGLYGSTNNKAF